MRNILESEETIQAYANIDFCYYSLKGMMDKLNEPVSPIHSHIDKATGYNPIKKNIDDIIDILKELISNKKIIEADCTGDEKMLEEMIKLKNI